MKLIIPLFLLGLSFIAFSCEIEAEEINYGSDACSYCSMTIVDQLHASELVTDKGRVYKYDAVECLINDLKERDTTSVGMLLVTDYSNPGNLIPASSATYLISDQIPSPMGAYLSAFSKSLDAEVVKSEMGGSIYSWLSIRMQIEK